MPVKLLIAFLKKGWNKLYGIKEILYFYNCLYLKKASPVIVYQMGKIGSSSVEESLKRHGTQFMFRVHRMNPDNIRKVRKEYLDINQKPPNERLGKRLYRNIVLRRRKAKFITLVRDPISRNISAFFQNFRRFTGDAFKNADFTIEKMSDVFLKNYKHSVPLMWFDVEMKQTLGIDIYEYPFSKEKGYLSIKKGNFELLILKSEIDDSTKESAIKDFLGVEGFKLIRKNVAQNKEYAEKYQDFIQTIKLPKAYVEIMCNSEYMKHFYDDSEVESIRSKWLDNIHRKKLQAQVHHELLKAASRVSN